MVLLTWLKSTLEKTTASSRGVRSWPASIAGSEVDVRLCQEELVESYHQGVPFV